MTNEIATAGPAWTPAARPVRTKMPVPMMTPTPKTVRSNPLRSRRSLCAGSSVSAIDRSTDLVRSTFIRSSPRLDAPGATPGLPSGGRGTGVAHRMIRRK